MQEGFGDLPETEDNVPDVQPVGRLNTIWDNVIVGNLVVFCVPWKAYELCAAGTCDLTA